MNLREWSESEVEYGRKVLNSGLAGARSGREAFLNGRPLTPFLERSSPKCLNPSCRGSTRRHTGQFPGTQSQVRKKTIVFGLFGWAIGLGVGIAWQSRGLTACAANGALEEYW